LRERKGIFYNIDWLTVFLYLSLVFIGWINIYAAVYNEDHQSIFDFSQNYGKQLMWIISSVILAMIILMIDIKFFSSFSYIIYLLSMVSLVAVLLLGKEIAGSKSWFQFGSFAIQPAEFAKFATCLAIARYLNVIDRKMQSLKTKILAFLILLLPAGLILLQNDTGSALVYFSFILVLYREGLSGSFLILGGIIAILFLLTLWLCILYAIGIVLAICLFFLLFIKRNRKNIFTLIAVFIIAGGFIFSVDYAFENILEKHQKTRINVLIGKETDIRGAGYNVHQSKIAIGSGGLTGKGFLKGTQTKYNFVPEQSTDFIFCTIGEEWGFAGSFVVVFLFSALLIRLIMIAERQKSKFSRIYGYGVASILFFHFIINIGMTIGIAPVIGIPLPFISYGGSSLWAFTILLFIFIRQDASRRELL
jgi:rod shape determining protein RodA